MECKKRPAYMFCAYATIDAKWWKRLEIHLVLLQRQEMLASWHGQPFSTGIAWSKEAEHALEMASLILLLISPEFLASDDSYKWSLRCLLESEQRQDVCIIPILLRPVDWQGTPFTYLQFLPTNCKPITRWRDRDQAFCNVTSGIRRTLSNLYVLSTTSYK